MAFFDDCRFVIQCDRRGGGDFVNNISGRELCSSEFIAAINPMAHGFVPTHGLPTDVYTLKSRGLRISCANISCGYYEPHTCNEYTKIADLKKCRAFVRHIIRTCKKVYPHKNRKRTIAHRSYFDWDHGGGYRWPRTYNQLIGKHSTYEESSM